MNNYTLVEGFVYSSLNLKIEFFFFIQYAVILLEGHSEAHLDVTDFLRSAVVFHFKIVS